MRRTETIEGLNAAGQAKTGAKENPQEIAK
jgi:hypothetical protein